MPKTIAIGSQSFSDIRKENCFFIDKTLFIKDWWENKDSVTLITRPRRFGKTLNMDMMNALQPETVKMININYSYPGSLGDGIKACLWAGAAMDETHAGMLFDRDVIRALFE